MIIILLYIISNCRTGINQFVLNDLMILDNRMFKLH